MKIGLLGLGKLGLPVALAIESKGHEVYGYEISQKIIDSVKNRKMTYEEAGAQDLLNKTNLKLCESIDELGQCDIVFIAVQTPHDPFYEGVTRLPATRVDFDYTHLVAAVKQLKDVQGDFLTVIISTVLPGTIESRILPIMDVVYNPFFIAMGTVIEDFFNPEFVLMGFSYNVKSLHKLITFYKSIHNARHFPCEIREAEMIKVSYNTFITGKIAMANTIGEMCHKLHINSDVVMDCLKLGADRIISTAYLNAGMGDGCGCHPRDNIALSWLAKNLNMSYDWYENLMIQREKHTEFLAGLIIEQHFLHPELPIVILGRACKPNSTLTVGSPALLLGNILKEKGIEFEYDIKPIHSSAIYFIGVAHDEYKKYIPATMRKNDIVLDPFGIIQEGNFSLIKIGR